MSGWRVGIRLRSSRLFKYSCTYLNAPDRQALLWMEMTSGAEKTVGRAEDFSEVSVDDSAYNRQYRVKVYLCVNYLLRSRLQVWSPTWEKTAGSLQVCQKYPPASVSVPVCNCASTFWLLALKRPCSAQQTALPFADWYLIRRFLWQCSEVKQICWNSVSLYINTFIRFSLINVTTIQCNVVYPHEGLRAYAHAIVCLYLVAAQEMFCAEGYLGGAWERCGNKIIKDENARWLIKCISWKLKAIFCTYMTVGKFVRYRKATYDEYNVFIHHIKPIIRW